MATRIGILTIKGPDYHPTRRLAEAAQARGAQVVVIDPYTLALTFQNGRPVFIPPELTNGLQAVLPRQGAEIKPASLAVVGHFEQMGICVINGLSGIMKARNKYATFQSLAAVGLDMPETIYATSHLLCQLARQTFAPLPAVVKPISGRQGTGVHCLYAQDELPDDIAAELEASRGVIVQAFIPPRNRHDIRVLIVGGQVAGAVSLTPPDGDFRANVHVGGKIEPIDLSDSLSSLARRAVQAVGLDIAGVDLVIPHNGAPMIVEVNYAPGFQGLEAATGSDVAGTIIDYVLSKAAACPRSG